MAIQRTTGFISQNFSIIYHCSTFPQKTFCLKKMVGYQLANFVPRRFLSSKGNLVCLLRKCFYCYIDLLFATFYCHNRANFLAKSQKCQTKKISRWLRPILWKPKDGLLTSSHDSKHSKKIHYLIGQAFKNHVYKVATLVLKNQPLAKSSWVRRKETLAKISYVNSFNYKTHHLITQVTWHILSKFITLQEKGALMRFNCHGSKGWLPS